MGYIRRGDGQGNRRRFFFGRYRLFIAPEVELALKEIEKPMLECKNKRLAVVFEEGKSGSEPKNTRDQGRGDIHGERAPNDIAHSRAADEIHELLESKRPKYLILDLDELRNLKLHPLDYIKHFEEHSSSSLSSL